MELFDIAWNNIRRRKGRVLLLVLGLTIGVTTVVALQAITRTLQADVGNKLDEFGANILIVPHSNSLSLSYGGLAVSSATFDLEELRDQDVAQVWTIPNARNISIVAPKLLSVAEVREQAVLVAGVDFESELRMKPWWQLEGSEPETEGQALAGSRVATLLDLSVGSPLQVGDQVFQVVAVLAENGQQDDDMLFVDLSAAQRALDRPGAISLVEVAALCTACPIEDMVAQIQAVLPQARVTALRQAVALRMEMVGQLMRFSWALSAVVLVIGGLVVLTTMLGAVAERKQEIGVLRAIGFRRRHIIHIILTEATLVSLLGGTLGWLVGMGAAAALTPVVTQVDLPVSWDPLIALWAVSSALLVGVAASLYPAVRAARLDPTTALRAL
ncbi:MAG: ABC transporter permease [Anaerolineae bacterium]|nr:ABC transporter permease [Anaerolineae bacterium]